MNKDGNNAIYIYMPFCKDDYLDIREWIEHHKRMGFGNFYVFFFTQLYKIKIGSIS